MPSQLLQRFEAYVSAARQKVARIEPRGRHFRVLLGGITFQEAVAELEAGPEFSSLVEETTAVFGERHGRGGWRQAAGNWFRRSGLYERLAAGETANNASAFESYCLAFCRERSQTTYLALMEFVHFAKEEIVFGPFTIRRMSKEELERTFQNGTTALFYPWARIPSDGLSGYWWLITRETERISPVGTIRIDFSPFYRVPRIYTLHPDPVELALQVLVLYRWLPPWTGVTDLTFQWEGFGIPFTLRVNDNLRESRIGRIPDVTALSREPVFDPVTGEEDDSPTIWFHLDKSETVRFEAFMQEQASRIIRLREVQWSKDLIDVALGFLVKAFFARGVEQLLWHITTIEALFGENSAGLTNRLAQRLSRVLGNTEVQRREVQKQFKELYRIRSELVHGTPVPKEVEAAHLNTARELARSATLWFIHWIDDVLSRANREPTQLPKREELLQFLDLEPNSRNRIRWLAESVSSEFPSIRSWLE